jgi:hypothetical protein
MRSWILAAVMAALSAAPGLAAPPTAADDVAALKQYLAADKSYSPAERREAEAWLAETERLAPRLSKAQMELRAAHLAAITRNGHSILFPGMWSQSFPRIPLRLALFSGRLYVLDAPDEPKLIGAEVTAIDGVPAAKIRAAYARYQGSRPGFADQFFPFFAETPAMLHAAGLTGLQDAARVSLKLHGGRAVTRLLRPRMFPIQGEAAAIIHPALRETGLKPTAPDGSPQPLYLREPEHAFLLAPAPQAHALYVALRAVRDAGPEKIADFLARVRETIAAQKPKNLILDLRFNMGGDLNAARDLMQALPALVPGRIYVITSGMTFSAAISSAGYLKQAGGRRVVIVGEPVGDRLEFWAERDTIDLPWSGGLMLYATERHNYVTGCQQADCHKSIRLHPIRVRSLEPDIPAPMTIGAFLHGRDPAMQAIVRAEQGR